MLLRVSMMLLLLLSLLLLSQYTFRGIGNSMDMTPTIIVRFIFFFIQIII
jgi:hypothetical protein